MWWVGPAELAGLPSFSGRRQAARAEGLAALRLRAILDQVAQPLRLDPFQLAGQLIGRIRDSDPPELRRLVAEAEAWDGDPADLLPTDQRSQAAGALALDRVNARLLPRPQSLLAPGGPLKRTSWLDGGPSAIALAGHGGIVTGYIDGSIDPRYLGVQGRPVRANDRAVQALALTPDGHVMVSGDDDGGLFLWRLEVGVPREEPLQLELFDSGVTAVALSADGRIALVGTEHGTVHRLDLLAGKELAAPPRHHGAIVALALSSDGRRAVSAARDGRVHLWGLQTVGRTGRSQTLEPASPCTAASLGGDEALLTGHLDGTVTMWTAEVPPRPRAVMGGHPHPVVAVTHDADGRHADSASRWYGTALRRWDLAQVGPANWLVGGPAPAVRVAAAAGTRALLITADRRAVLADGDRRRHGQSLRWQPTVATLAASAAAAVIGDRDGGVWLWWPDVRGEPARLGQHHGAVTAAVIATDGRWALTGAVDGAVRIWDLGGSPESWDLTRIRGAVTALALTADGRRAYAAGGSGLMHALDVEEGVRLRTQQGPAREVSALATVPGEPEVVVVGWVDGLVEVWHVGLGLRAPMGNRVHMMGEGGHMDTVTALDVAPDGRTAVSSGLDQSVTVWDIEAMQRRARLTLDLPVVASAFAGPADVLAVDMAGTVHRLAIR